MQYEGFIETNDKGVLYIYNKEQFDAFFKENQDSKFIFKAQKISAKSSDRLTAYFFAEVLPKFIKGFQEIGERHNKASMMQELKKYSTLYWESVMLKGKIEHKEREFEDLNFFEKKALISELIEIAATQLNVVIEEPK